MTFWIAVGSLCAICGILAVLLVIADRYLNDYGICKLIINKGAREEEVEGGSTLLNSLNSTGIFIPSACGGQGSCGLCKLKVTAGAPPILPTEEPHLSKEERADNVRLCCQLKVHENMELEIPEELFNIREFNGTVESLENLNHDIKRLRIALPAGEELDIIPGQYMQIETPAYKKTPEPVYRAYSIATDPRDKTHIDLVIRLVPGGICTTYVFEHMKEQQTLALNGPYGDFRLTDTGKEMIFIAGGSGMAPFLSMLAHIQNEGITRNVTYFFGARSKRDLICLDKMAAFEAALPNFKFVPCLSEPMPDDNWDGETGLVTEVMKRHCPDLTEMEAYLCGSPGMCDASVAALTANGMPAENIFFDKF
ncbi:MAG: 2Fe-2S iron-sulfur cluster binding domain-containing protein [Verrucomicrobia bacterium]|nr:2Fe-2S iron-sulfur cluster binding domain-containing protein [Verrucomicrobiota bacterium]